MKKIFFVLMLGAMALSITSCKQNEPSTPDSGEKNAISVTFSGENMDEFEITFTPQDPDMYYSYAFTNKYDVDGLTKEQLEKNMQDFFTYPEDFLKGEKSISLESWMSPSTEYIILVYPVAEGCIINGEIVKETFTTPNH